MPTIVVVGRGLADGMIELRDRRSGEQSNVALADALGEIVAAVHGRPAWLTCAGTRSRARHVDPADRGGFQRRLGGRRGGRRRPYPASGVTDRIAATTSPATILAPTRSHRSGAPRRARSPMRSRSNRTGGRCCRSCLALRSDRPWALRPQSCCRGALHRSSWSPWWRWASTPGAGPSWV